jgi:hypothetical protein
MTKKRTPMNAPDMLALLRDAPVERTAELLASVDDYRRADLGAVRVGAKPRSRKARGDRESLTDEGALRVPASAAQLGWKMVFGTRWVTRAYVPWCGCLPVPSRIRSASTS